MTHSQTDSWLELRFLVGYLGERAQFSWWPTGFYEPSARLFLEPVFTRTGRLAQYHGVLEAARRLHDEHLNVGSYHLFRLPEELEQDLQAKVRNASFERFAALAATNREAALDLISRFINTSVKASVGPLLVGRVQELESPEILHSCATAYQMAFVHGTRTYPYFAA